MGGRGPSGWAPPPQATGASECGHRRVAAPHAHGRHGLPRALPDVEALEDGSALLASGAPRHAAARATRWAAQAARGGGGRTSAARGEVRRARVRARSRKAQARARAARGARRRARARAQGASAVPPQARLHARGAWASAPSGVHVRAAPSGCLVATKLGRIRPNVGAVSTTVELRSANLLGQA